MYIRNKLRFSELVKSEINNYNENITNKYVYKNYNYSFKKLRRKYFEKYVTKFNTNLIFSGDKIYHINVTWFYSSYRIYISTN